MPVALTWMKSVKTHLFILIVFFVALGSFLFPKTASAHDMYYVQTTLDVTSYKYTGMARMDKTGISGLESGHIANDYDFSNLLDDNLPVVSGTSYEAKSMDTFKDPKYTFGFPFQEQGELWGGKEKNNATKADADQAQYIASTLPTQLNDFLDLIYEGDRPNNIEEHVQRMNDVTSAIASVAGGGSTTLNGYTIERGKLKPYKKGYDSATGVSNEDWIIVSKGNFKHDFIFRVPKGYKDTGKWDNSHLQRDYKYSDDAKYMTWNMLVYQAHYFYFGAGVSTTNSYAIGEPGFLEAKIVEVLESVLGGLKGILGLYSMEELIYNEGIRDSSAWHYGVFATSYDAAIQKFHMVFQALAWSLLIAAMYKLLIQRNLSVVNPAMRVSLMNGVMDLFITAFILVLIYPLIEFLMLINYRIVDIFASMGVSLDNLAGLNSYNGLLSGIIMQFYYFFIEIWLNFLYIVRSTVLAVLVVCSPLFVSSIAFGSKWKQLFGTFMKELTANIFIQSFQAFVITFILLTSSQSRGIELAIILFSLVVLTEFFRGLVFGSAGNIGGKIGAGAIQSGAGFLASAAKQNQKNKMMKQREQSSKSQEDKGGESSSSNSGEASLNNTDTSENFNFSKMKSPTMKKGMETLAEVSSYGVAATKAVATTGVGAGYALAFGAMDGGAAKAGGGLMAMGANANSLRAARNNVNAGVGFVSGMGDKASGAIDAINNAGSASYIPSGMYDQNMDSVNNDGGGSPTSEPVISTSSNATNNPTSTGEASTNSIGAALVNRKGANPTKDGHAQDRLILDRGKMEAMGVKAMNTDNIGGLYARYNPSNMNQEQRDSLDMIEAAYKHGNAEDRAALKAMGINRVSVDEGNGDRIVSYNAAGRESLGITSAHSSDNGFSQVVPSGVTPSVIPNVSPSSFSEQAVSKRSVSHSGNNVTNSSSQPADNSFEYNVGNQGSTVAKVSNRKSTPVSTPVSTPTHSASSVEPNVMPTKTTYNHNNSGTSSTSSDQTFEFEPEPPQEKYEPEPSPEKNVPEPTQPERYEYEEEIDTGYKGETESL